MIINSSGLEKKNFFGSFSIKTILHLVRRIRTETVDDFENLIKLPLRKNVYFKN